jgi:hypothetical protein
MRLFAMVLLTVLMSSCQREPAPAAVPAAPRAMTDAEIEKADASALCIHYAKSRQTSIRDALVSQNYFNLEHFNDFDKGTFPVGHGTLSVLCARGMPKNVSVTTTARGERKVFQYDDMTVSFGEDGLVDSIHERF